MTHPTYRTSVAGQVSMLFLVVGLAAQTSDLTALLSGGKLRPVNRTLTRLQGARPGVHVSESGGPGVVWIDGSSFSEGTIAVDVRGRDVAQQSFLGVAFHRKDDSTYEGVYLRPFNFRSSDPAAHHHAVQYISVPEFDWPRLRQQFPEKFEGAVDPSVAPTDWVTLRVIVDGQSVRAFVGSATTPALDVRRLGTLNSGEVGLWVGNNSGGDFSNVRMTTGR